MSHSADIFVAIQRILPKHALSRLVGKLAESKRTRLKNFLINRAISVFAINMEEAASADLNDYDNFNAFFTRALRTDARPIDNDDNIICCPRNMAAAISPYYFSSKFLSTASIPNCKVSTT